MSSFLLRSLCQVRRTVRRSLLVSKRPAVFVAALALTASVIASPLPPQSAPAQPAPSGKVHRWFQIGRASWYGRAFQGKRTATGERFDMNSLTCAHRTLPLGSWLRVTNLTNMRSTFVRVNDRGPYKANTIVDLSYAAAQRLGMLGKSSVRVEPVRADDPELAQALIAELTQPSLPVAP